MEPDVHYRLIKQIERFPALYNYHLPDYANKLVCDKLWDQIAKKTNSSVGECKEKWRNIRSSFIRSRKAPVNGSRPKKTYYLAEHLSFILPYIKARDFIPLEDDKDQENIEEGDTQSQDCNFDANKSEEDDFEATNKEETETTFCNEPYPMSLSSVRSRKRRISEDETSEYVKRKDNRKAEKQKHPMHYFFLSLSDEFETMDERQLRQFKIKVLQALDEIKSNKEMPLGSSPAYSSATSQNIVAYSTKNTSTRENNHTHCVGPSASPAKSREPKCKDTLEVNIQDAEFDGDSVIKLESDITFD